ncbi:MAG: 3-deoxy-7-phosphoheptulonate synthase [Chloroflexi bacterium]|nr:3-deoxy-7-phosphoheptulonate synthase [Chloroflexota bacterium]
MIVAMSVRATEEEIENVLKRLEHDGYAGQMSRGAERAVIGVIGTGFPEDYKDHLEVLPGVESVTRISKPYKLSSRDFKPTDTVIDVRGVRVGGGEFVVMAGPCAVEGREHILETAEAVGDRGAVMLRGGAFKPRTSPYSFQGLGEDGLRYLAEARERCGLPVITEVMEPSEVDLVEGFTDVLQIGTRNMQNFPLLRRVGQARKPVMLKRGMSATIEEWLMASEYILAEGNQDVMLCERGIRTFETMLRNTLDLSCVPMARRLTHLPIIVDPSHGTGKWYLVKPMALAAAAVGADGIIVEVHPDPDNAWSDGPQALTPDNFGDMMKALESVVEATGRRLWKVPATV